MRRRSTRFQGFVVLCTTDGGTGAGEMSSVWVSSSSLWRGIEDRNNVTRVSCTFEFTFSRSSPLLSFVWLIDWSIDCLFTCNFVCTIPSPLLSLVVSSKRIRLLLLWSSWGMRRTFRTRNVSVRRTTGREWMNGGHLGICVCKCRFSIFIGIIIGGGMVE